LDPLVLSVTDATALLHANSSVSISAGYTLSDTAVNLGTVVGGSDAVVSNSGFSGYSVVDSAAAILAAVNTDSLHSVLTGASSISSNDSSTVSLSVADADTLTRNNSTAPVVISITMSHGYNLLDTAVNLASAFTNGDAAISNSYYQGHAATSDSAVVSLNVDDATTLVNNSVTITHGYNLSDTAVNLAAASATVGNGAQIITVSGSATVAQAATIDSFSAHTITPISIVDSVANLVTGNAHAVVLAAAGSVTVLLDGSDNDVAAHTLDSGVQTIDLNGQAAILNEAQLTLTISDSSSGSAGTITEQLTANRDLTAGLHDKVNTIDLNGFTATVSEAEVSLIRSSTLSISDSSLNSSGRLIERLGEDVNFNTSDGVQSQVTGIDLHGHIATLTDSELSSLASISDSGSGGYVTEVFTGAANDLTGGSYASFLSDFHIGKIDLNAQQVTLTDNQITTLVGEHGITNSSNGWIAEKLTGNDNLTSVDLTGEFVKQIDFNGHHVTLTHSQIGTIADEFGFTDSVGSGYVIEQASTDNEDQSSGSLNSSVLGYDLHGHNVTLSDTEVNQLTQLLSDSIGGHTLTVLDTGNNVSLLSHSSLVVNVNLNGNDSMTLSGLASGDKVNVGSASTLTTAETDAGSVTAAHEYFFDSSSHALTWADDSNNVHTVTLTSISSVTLTSDQHTFQVIHA
jgi:Cu/Ag efflux protein CusF